ncbi:MAG: hypothetical protein KDK91_30990, partial [Gammaproteobacteria bacterium]|nr:hypothetical protein [Gammaproteobacteria bacterium]
MAVDHSRRLNRVDDTPRIHVIHENPEWSAPLFEALSAQGLPWVDWNLQDGCVDLHHPPPAGVFYSRMSASSHTRGHRYSPELTGAVLAWLERHSARVVNGSEALRLELSKAAQHAALTAFGIRVPDTTVVHGEKALLAAARGFERPFITKHNRAGKGLGVRLFEGFESLQRALPELREDAPVDGLWLLQDYIRAPQPFITRVEFVGGQLLYAVRVDTSDGFELCPADVCSLDGQFCPTSDDATEADGAAAPATPPRFEIIEDFRHPLVASYEAFLARHGIEVAAFEFIVDAKGEAFTYDINTNTNYNSAAETRAGLSGMRRL